MYITHYFYLNIDTFFINNLVRKYYCFVISHNSLSLFDILADRTFNLLDLNIFAIRSCKYVMVVNELMYVATEDYISYFAIMMSHNKS